MQKIIGALVINNYIQDGGLRVVRQTKNYDDMYKKALDAVKV
jgi:hypothetical protein